MKNTIIWNLYQMFKIKVPEVIECFCCEEPTVKTAKQTGVIHINNASHPGKRVEYHCDVCDKKMEVDLNTLFFYERFKERFKE